MLADEIIDSKTGDLISVHAEGLLTIMNLLTEKTCTDVPAAVGSTCTR